jgi:hypothetical protein
MARWRKSDPVGDGVGVAGERASGAGQCRSTLDAGMSDVLKFIRFGATVIPRGCDGRDRHPVSAIRAREEETRQV